jgi:hypothetical protein
MRDNYSSHPAVLGALAWLALCILDMILFISDSAERPSRTYVRSVNAHFKDIMMSTLDFFLAE